MKIKTHLKYALLNFTIILFTIVLGYQDLTAQSWRYPDCNDLVVEKIEQSEADENKLEITVFNACDTCATHVYTGLIVFHQNDTIAIEDQLYSKPSPENNASFVYTLLKESEVVISDKIRVEMVGICDSIPMSPVVLDVNSNKTVDELDIRIFPNPFKDFLIIQTSEQVQIEEFKIRNTNGQLIWKGNTPHFAGDLSKYISGFYFIEIKTDQGVVIKKIFKMD